MSINYVEKSYDVVVVGGGLSGMCAAIAAARHGANTCIIQNRSVYGGNASSEVRMHIVGASSHAAKSDLAETGILLEMLMENKRRNPYASFPVFDSILWEFIHFQENLTPYLNTNMDDAIVEDGKITAVICHQNTTETEFKIFGKIFIDATDECPKVADFVAMVHKYGGVAAYAYLGDVGNSVTGDKKAQKFEDDYLEDVFECLKEEGVKSVTYMPTRNTPEQLERLTKLCDEHGFFQISGEDINSPRQSFVIKAMENPMFQNLIDATWKLIEHENR